MKSNYKRLGDYIRQVDVRNKDEKVTRLLGVSIDKKFIESIANTIGTDMSVYKIVKHRQFAYGPVTSRNGDKVSIALLLEEECIISSSYTVFEITDTKKLLPEYLDLWFKRPEFDRYARFHSHGSAREIFDWEEMCNVELPVPPIEEQQKMVDAYQKIETRIALKKKINENLELQANTIFKEKMISYLDCDEEAIPNGYIKTSLTDVASYLNGLAMQNFPSLDDNNFLPVLKIRELRQGCVDTKSDKCSNKIKSDYIINNGDVIFSWSGTLYVDLWCGGKAGLNQHLFKVISKKYPKWLYYFWTKYHLSEFIKIADGKKTSMGHIKREDLEAACIIIPNVDDLKCLDSYFSPILETIIKTKQELVALSNTQKFLLSDLSSR